MNILDAILGAQGGGATAEAGQAVGLSQDQTAAALSAVVPALASGLQRNASAPGGLESLIGALTNGGHARYVDDPLTLRADGATTDGNAILGHILGSKDASRAVASNASAQTGISEDVLKKLLPIAATMIMGSLAKQHTSGTTASALPGAGILASLTPMLDRNRDGSVVDDVLGQVGKIFTR